MIRILLLTMVALLITLAACSENGTENYDYNDDGSDITFLNTFSVSESRREVEYFGREFMNEFGYCREGCEIVFDITSTDDARFRGIRTQYDSLYSQADGPMLMNGRFEWVNEDGSWIGTFDGTISMVTGVEVEMKGYGQGAYSGLYFEGGGGHPGDPTRPTSTGTFTGDLYRLPE